MNIDEITKDIVIRAQKAPWGSGVELLIKQGDYIAEPVVFTKMVEGYAYEPTLSISMNSAQRLMDELWIAGLRPSEGTGSAGSLKATQDHLNDMRDIVFNELNIMRKV